MTFSYAIEEEIIMQMQEFPLHRIARFVAVAIWNIAKWNSLPYILANSKEQAMGSNLIIKSV